MSKKIAVEFTMALVALVLAGCSGTGKIVVTPGGDLAAEDSGFSSDVVPEGDAAGPAGGDALLDGSETVCSVVCSGKICGNWEQCECGQCSEGFVRGDKGDECLPEAESCQEMCSYFECGDVGPCQCGVCGDGLICKEGTCIKEGCEALCQDPDSGLEYQCGDDGCGGSCGECDAQEWCDEHMCIHDDPPPTCQEACAMQGADCGAPEDEDLDDCSCGNCVDGFVCVENKCVEEPPNCAAVCAFKDCGVVDGCDCGSCDAGYFCNDKNKCEKDACDPECSGKECGPDGCGSVCGQCVYGSCSNGACVCQSQCGAKECGPNGCGGTCGICPGAEVCAWDGMCYFDCNPAQVGFSPTVQRLNYMAIGEGGHAGEAADVDGDPATCAPYGDCDAGYDNSMGGLFESLKQFLDVNQELSSLVENGGLNLLAELVTVKYDGSSFGVNMYLAEPVLPKYQCNFQTTKCEYLVDGGAIDLDTCLPFVTFDNAIIVDGVLTAGGFGYEFAWVLPFVPGSPMAVTILNARIVADVQLTAGGELTLVGVIGGAIPKETLIDAVDDLPDQGLPISKDMIKSLLGTMITNDIDTNGDGVKDAASIGIKFTSIGGEIVGVF